MATSISDSSSGDYDVLGWSQREAKDSEVLPTVPDTKEVTPQDDNRTTLHKDFCNNAGISIKEPNESGIDLSEAEPIGNGKTPGEFLNILTDKPPKTKGNIFMRLLNLLEQI